MSKAKLKEYPWRPLYVGDPKWELLFKLPPAALKVWLFHYSMEGENRASWPSIETIADVCDMNKKTVVTARRWLIENGWLVRVGEIKTRDGQFTVPKFRVRRGTVHRTQELGSNHTQKTGTSQSQKLGHKQTAFEQEAFEPEALSVLSVSQSYAATPPAPEKSKATPVGFHSEIWQEAYASLTDPDYDLAERLPKLFGIGRTPEYMAAAERMASAMEKLNRNASWLHDLVRWVKTGKGREPNFWRIRIHAGVRGFTQLAKHLETGELPTQFDAHHATTSHNARFDGYMLYEETQQ